MGKKKSKGLELADMMPRRVHVGPGSLRAIKTDLEFMRLVVELAKETGVLITLVANAALELENHPSSWPWPRNRAILGGLLVRLSKLYSALVEAVCKRKAELSRV